MVEAVHAKGAYFVVQLWSIGRANTGTDDVKRVVSSGDIGLNGVKVEPLPLADIRRQCLSYPPLRLIRLAEYIDEYRRAALNARKAGFDGVEVLGEADPSGCDLPEYMQPPMAISCTNFSIRTATTGRTSTAAASRTGPASCWRRSRRL